MRFLIDYAKATTTKASRAAFVMESTLETNGMSDVNLAMPLMKQTNKQNIFEHFLLHAHCGKAIASGAAFVMESIHESNGTSDVNLATTHYLAEINKQTNKQNILEHFFIAFALLESYRKRRSFCNGKHP